MKHLIFLLLIPLFLQGQQSNSLRLDIAYSGGNIVHPGLCLGAFKTIHEHEKVKRNGNTRTRQWELGGRLGSYYHRNYQTSLWVQGEAAWKNNHLKGSYYRFSLGIGGLQSWVPKSYRFTRSGELEYVGARGIPYILVSPSVEWGWRPKKSLPWVESYFIRPRLQWQAPYFQGSNHYFLFEFGISLKS